MANKIVLGVLAVAAVAVAIPVDPYKPAPHYKEVNINKALF